MKGLSKAQMAGFAQMVAATHDHEINCSECASLAAEFVERRIAGLPLDGATAKVEQHLQICPECTEELNALKNILKSEK